MQKVVDDFTKWVEAWDMAFTCIVKSQSDLYNLRQQIGGFRDTFEQLQPGLGLQVQLIQFEMDAMNARITFMEGCLKDTEDKYRKWLASQDIDTKHLTAIPPSLSMRIQPDTPKADGEWKVVDTNINLAFVPDKKGKKK